MPSIIASFGKKKVFHDNCALISKIDPLSNQIFEYMYGENYEFLIGRRKHVDSGIRYYEDKRWICFLAGDIPLTMHLDWRLVTDSILSNKFSKLYVINSPNMILCVDKLRNYSYIISDIRSQYPIFLYENSKIIVIANSISAIVGSNVANKINKNWILEYLFFNYPVMNTSLLDSVTKLPPCSCVKIDNISLKIEINEISSIPRRVSRPLSSQDELYYVADVFKSTVQDYSSLSDSILLPLTGGLDSQTILACLNCSGLDKVTTYTYGTENSDDILAAKKTIKRYKIPHQIVCLEEDFLEKLPNLIEETLYLSGGMERILRSTLAYVYRTVQKDEPKRVLSGVSGDHIFRDHIRGRGNVPSIISSYFMDYIQGKEIEECCNDCIINFDKNERKYLYDVIDKMNYKYGDLRRGEGYSNFLVYECGPKYFSGEAAIASHFGPFNSIYWDNRIVNLLYEVDNSTLGLCLKYKEKKYFHEKFLQSNIIHKFAAEKRHVNSDLPVSVFASGSVSYYFVTKILLRGFPKILNSFFKKQYYPQENWDLWINDILDFQFRELIYNHSHIQDYVSSYTINSIINSKDFRMKAKLVNIELILRLLDNGWRYGVLK